MLKLMLIILIICYTYTQPPPGCMTRNCYHSNYYDYNYCNRCITCQSGYTLDLIQYYCCLNAYKDHCYYCNSANTCSQCVNSYGLNSTSMCELCSNYLPNCTNCDKINSCTVCSTGYAVNKTNSLGYCATCQSLMPYCKQCTSNKICTACNESNFYLKTTVSPDFCGTCSQIIQGCTNCTSQYNCLSCINNSYYLYFDSYSNTRLCYKCNKFYSNCSTCQGMNECITCIMNYTYFDTVNKSCVFCNVSLPYCLECEFSNNCLRCQPVYYALVQFLGNKGINVCRKCDEIMTGCIQCQSASVCTQCIGRIVKYGCTKVPGCLEVDPTLPTVKNCLKCESHSFLQTAVDSLCLCNSGQIVGQFCTELLGCITLSLIKNIKTCVNCNISANFAIQNNTCVCKKYYSLKNRECKQTCGDGHLYQLDCDDGNLIDGDGCSSKCTIQPHFSCINNRNSFPSSKCRYKGKVEIIPEGIFRVADKNSIKLLFKVSPYHPIFTKMNLTKVISFSLNNSEVKQSTIQNGMLTIVIDFFEDIQGKQAEITLQYDPQYVNSPIFTTKITMIESNGLRLTVQQFSSQQKTLISKILTIVSYCSIACLFVGSSVYRMIGIETIQTIQSVFIYLASCTTYQYYFKTYDSLSMAFGILPSQYQFSRGIKNQFYTNLGYDIDFKYNISSILYVNLSTILLYCSIKLIATLHDSRIRRNKKQGEECLSQKMRIKYALSVRSLSKTKQRITKAQEIIEAYLLFPLTVGFSFHFIYSLAAYMLFGQAADLTYECLLALVLSQFALSIEASKLFLQIFRKIKKSDQFLKHNRQIYPSIYLLRAFFSFSVPFLATYISSSHIYQIFAVVSLLYLFFVAFYRPYRSLIHNASILWNQLTLSLTFTWIIVKDHQIYKETVRTVFQLAMVGSILLVLFFSLIRVIFGIRQKILATKQKRLEDKQSQLQRMDSRCLEKQPNDQIRFEEGLYFKQRQKLNYLVPNKSYALNYINKLDIEQAKQSFFQRKKIRQQLIPRIVIDSQ